MISYALSTMERIFGIGYDYRKVTFAQYEEDEPDILLDDNGETVQVVEDEYFGVAI